MAKPTYFATPAEWRGWLARNHEAASDVIVGFYKRASGRPSITWPESVDQALCFGWIDGVRRSVDETRYTIRFSPRKGRSNWSTVNIKRMRELIDLGLVHAAGLAAFEARDEKRSGIYSYEARHNAAFDEAMERRFKANKAAWAFFSAQAPWYRRVTTYWITSAKHEATREKRLAMLMNHSAAGRRLPSLDRAQPAGRAPNAKPRGAPARPARVRGTQRRGRA